MICVLNILVGPASGKRIWLKENQIIEVGRMASSDFPIPADSHLSRRHMLIDSTGNLFRVRDVGSSNGTYVNNKKITVQTLHHGDIIRAGTTVFSVSFLEEGENPHKEEGITFGNTLASPPPSEPTGQAVPLGSRTIDFSKKWDIESTLRFTRDEVEALDAEVFAADSSGPAPSHGTVSGSEPQEESGLFMESLRALDSKSPAQEPQNNSEPPSLTGWVKEFCTQRDSSPVYDVSAPFKSPLGEFCGVLSYLSEGRNLTAVINLSQLPPEVVDRIRDLVAQGKEVSALSRTVIVIPLEREAWTWELVRSCLTQDAIVCLITDTPLAPTHLVEVANSLGFPSLFANHAKQTSSPLRRFIQKHQVIALFESNLEGGVSVVFG